MAYMNSAYNGFQEIPYEQPLLTAAPFSAASPAKDAFGSTITGYPVQETPRLESRGFLPTQSPRSARSSVSAPMSHIKRIPWRGLLSIAASGLTVLLSLAILLVVDHHVVWPNEGWSTFMRPASWLSALLSANGIFLHLALEEGLTVAWWYRASKPDATVRDLHDAWHHGTSLPAALFAGRRITYISMATIFCALLPLNGFLLQGAISTILSEETTEVEVNIPMVETLPYGYSGRMLDSGNIDVINSGFADVWVQILNLEASPSAGYAYAGAFRDKTTGVVNDWGCENSSICTTTARGAGFHVDCDEKLYDYDLYPYNETGSSGSIFGSSIWWERTEPNRINLEVYWKADSSCIGVLELRNCTLRAAIVEYPVQIQMNISSTNIYPGPYISLVAGTTRKDDVVVNMLPVAEGDGESTTTFGGISAYFTNYFNSNMSIVTYPSDENGAWVGGYYPHGQLCTSLSPGIPENKGANAGYFNSYCNLTFEFPLQEMRNQQMRDGIVLDPGVEQNIVNFSKPVDLAEVILEPFRHAMFLASVYEGFAWYGHTTNDLGKEITGNVSLFSDYTQTRLAKQVRPVSQYTVRYYLWGASLAVTYCIILFLIPLFWGFWTLKRKPTMSPVDLARAFKAPLLSEYDFETKTLLKHHGRRSIHHDLVSSPESWRRDSGGQHGYFDMTSPRSQ